MGGEIINVVVSGASTGIGREVVRNYASRGGFRVFALARRIELLESLSAEFPKNVVEPVAMDISSYEFNDLMQILNQRGINHIHILVNNAASLHQAFAHCEKFSTAATRRCLDRVSVPV